MIISPRKTLDFRSEVLSIGISQISTDSCSRIEKYYKKHSKPNNKDKSQFEVKNHRFPMDIHKSLCKSNYIPSYCTAYYRE